MVGRGHQAPPSSEPSSDEITIVCKPLYSAAFPLRVRTDETVDSVKFKLAPRAPETIRLFFDGVELTSFYAIQGWGIGDNAIVDLHVRFSNTLAPKRYTDDRVLTIQPLYGEPFPLRVNPEETVDDVTRHLASLSPFIHPAYIQLISNGEQLGNARTLKECRLDYATPVHMDIRFGRLRPPKHYSDEITVTIQPNRGAPFPLQVGRDETVDEVKYKIFWRDRSLIHPHYIRLIFKGKQLDHGRTMNECAIDDTALIHMVLRTGGRPTRLPTEPDPELERETTPMREVSVVPMNPEPSQTYMEARDRRMKYESMEWLTKEQEWRAKEQEWRAKEQAWRAKEQELEQTIRDLRRR
jgi:hypothetical protein